MASSTETRKKLIEATFVEEARRASAVFPNGELVPHEGPDFLLCSGQVTIGVEVTELCREGPRAEGGKLAMVANRAKERYKRLERVVPMEVSATFAPRIENVGLNRLVDGLVDFVHAHRHDLGRFNWKGLPEGYSYVAIREARQPTGQWRTFKAFDTILASRELIQSCIDKKAVRLPKYRNAAGEIWLLIVNNRFLGAGEVYARPDHVAQWKFAFDFDRVFMFLREPGGSGEVIELFQTRVL